MIFTLITGFVVGVYFGQSRPFLQNLLTRVTITLEEAQMSLASFALCLAVAGAALSLIGVQPYPVLLCLGAALGVARKPLLARITSARGA